MFDITGLSTDPAQSSTGLGGQIIGAVPFFQAPNSTTAVPTFTTADNWPVDQTYITSTVGDGGVLTPPVTSNVVFTGAYVTNGEFVNGTPTSATLTLSVNGVALTVPIQHAYVTFQHAVTGKPAVSGGIIAGVIDASTLIANLKGVAGNISTAFCGGTAFQTIATAIQQAADIMDDGTNVAGTACNGISIGIGFDADEIGLPQVIGQPATGTDACDTDGGTDSGVRRRGGGLSSAPNERTG